MNKFWLTIFCILLAILAVLSIVFGCLWKKVRDETDYDNQKVIIESYEKEVADLKSEIDSLHIDISILEEVKSSYESENADLINLKTDLEKEVADLKILNSNNDKTIAENQKRIAELQVRLEEYQTNLDEKNEEMERLNNEISKLKSLNSILESENLLYESTITSLNRQIVILNSKIVDLSNQLISNDNSLSVLNSKISQLEQSIAYYEQYISQLENGEQIAVTFEFAGSVYNIQIVSKSSKVSVVDPVSTEYFIFNYWEVDGERIDLSIYEFTANTKVVANVTKKYNVKFISDGLQYGVTQIVEENNCPELPMEPTKDKFRFIGWSLDGKTIIEDVENYEVTRDVSFIAIYESVITVTFMVDGEKIDEKVVLNGEIDDIPHAPLKKNFDFVGWSLNGSDILDFTEYYIEDSIVVIAKYEWVLNGTYVSSNYGTILVENDVPVSVTFNGKTIKFSSASKNGETYYYFNSTIKFNNPTSSVYVYFRISSLTMREDSVTGEKYFYAQVRLHSSSSSSSGSANITMSYKKV